MSTSSQFRIQICGNVDELRTEAEIFIPAEGAGPVAYVYESLRDWVVERAGDSGPVPPPGFDAAVAAAKGVLAEYVNRMGNGAPTGLTRPGLALWLMELRDGTAMGRPIR